MLRKTLIALFAFASLVNAQEDKTLADTIAKINATGASLAPIADRLASFRGAVFVKGSRKYALESLLGEAVHA